MDRNVEITGKCYILCVILIKTNRKKKNWEKMFIRIIPMLSGWGNFRVNFAFLMLMGGGVVGTCWWQLKTWTPECLLSISIRLVGCS